MEQILQYILYSPLVLFFSVIIFCIKIKQNISEDIWKKIFAFLSISITILIVFEVSYTNFGYSIMKLILGLFNISIYDYQYDEVIFIVVTSLVTWIYNVVFIFLLYKIYKNMLNNVLNIRIVLISIITLLLMGAMMFIVPYAIFFEFYLRAQHSIITFSASSLFILGMIFLNFRIWSIKK